MKKSGILLSILVLSMLTILLPCTLPGVKAQTLDPDETNSGVGRPYTDLTNLSAYSNGTGIKLNITLYKAPPKLDNETHINIYVVFNTSSGGERYFPDYVDAQYVNSSYYWEYCIALYSWTGNVPKNIDRITPGGTWPHVNATKLGVTVTNSTDGTIVKMYVPLTAINKTLALPTQVGIGVVTSQDGSNSPADTFGQGIPHYESWGQWFEIKPAIISMSTSAGTSASADDQTGDFMLKPFNDITKVDIGSTVTHLVVNVSFLNLSGLTSSKLGEQWDLSIGLDVDHVNGSGQAWMAYTQYDVKINTTAANNTLWERCVVIDNPPGDIHLYTTFPPYTKKNVTDLGVMGITAKINITQNKVQVSIPKAVIPALPQRLKLTVISAEDHGNAFHDVVGTWGYKYDPTVTVPPNTAGFFQIVSSIPLTEEILPQWPGDKVVTPPSVIGRPYQDIKNVSARSDGTNLYINVTLNAAPPKLDNETHVNIYVAIDNGTIGGSWQFPDKIDAGYTSNTTFWEYCLCLYNWTRFGGGAQYVNLTKITEYVKPPRTPHWSSVNATELGVTVTNSTDGKIVKIKIPYAALQAPKPNTVTIGVVTSEDFAKVKDTVGSGYARLSFSQWVEITPAITGLSTAMGSSAFATDTDGDFVGKAFWDVRNVSVGQKSNNVIVNVTFLNLSTLPWSFGEWRLSIGIDTDHIDGASPSGQDWMAFIGRSDAQINPAFNDTYWERCIVVDDPTSIHLFDQSFADMGSMGITASFNYTESKVVVSIPNYVLPPSPNRSLNLTIIAGTDEGVAGGTVYDVYGTYTYAYSPDVKHGFYLIRTGVPPTGPVMYSYPFPSISFNNAMGRPYQDLTGVSAHSNGTYLNVNITLNEGPPKNDTEAHVNIYVAMDTDPYGRDWFPDGIDARYNLSEPEHFWEYCFALYYWSNWTIGQTASERARWQDVDVWTRDYGRIDALSNKYGNATVTNSTDGRKVIMWIPLTLIDNPDKVTIGVVTIEDYSKIKDTIGSGNAQLFGSQWVQVEPAIIDLKTGACNSSSKIDPVKDFVGKSFWDITDVELKANATDIVVDVTFANVTGLSTSWDQWRLSIAIDTNHTWSVGEPWIGFIGYADTKVNPAANDTLWEICVVLDSNKTSDIHVYNTTWYDFGAKGVRASLLEAESKVRVAIPKNNLKFTDYNLTLTVVSGTDQGPTVYDVAGSYSYAYNPAVNKQGFYLVTTSSDLNRTGPFKAELSLVNITMVKLDLDQWLTAKVDPKLVLRFLTYDGKHQVNTTIWGPDSLPKRVTRLQNIQHPQGKAVEIVELVLVDDLGNIISVVARLIVTRTIMISRLTYLDGQWITSPGTRPAIMKEIVLIDSQWPYAPP